MIGKTIFHSRILEKPGEGWMGEGSSIKGDSKGMSIRTRTIISEWT